MSTSELVWLVSTIVVVAVVIAVAVIMTRGSRSRRLEQDRARSQELREEAAQRETDVRESQLRAREASLEADRARLEAEQAQARAAEAERGAQSDEALLDDQLREADRLDPDVDPDARADGEPLPPEQRASADGIAQGSRRGPAV